VSEIAGIDQYAVIWLADAADVGTGYELHNLIWHLSILGRIAVQRT